MAEVPKTSDRRSVPAIYVSLAIGRRKPKQPGLWTNSEEMPRTAAHPYYGKVNEVLNEVWFDRKVEPLGQRYYKPTMGRPSLGPGVYFRVLPMGWMEAIDGERALTWRVTDSLSLRDFLGCGLAEQTPVHSTVSLTRRLHELETHKAVFRRMFQTLEAKVLLDGQTVAIDGATPEAYAAMRSIRRRDDGRKYEDYLKELAQAEGLVNPTRKQLACLDRKWKEEGSNKEWMSPTLTRPHGSRRWKNGRTHLAHNAEHEVDLASGAILAAKRQAADQGDTATVRETLQQAKAIT